MYMPEPGEGSPQSNPESSQSDIPETGDPNAQRMVEDQQPGVKQPGRLSELWGKIKREKPPKEEPGLADSLTDGIEAEQGVPLNEAQKRSLRERLNSALNIKVPLTRKIARDLLLEGGAGAIAGVSVKTAVKTGLWALGTTSSLGIAAGIGAAGGAGAAVVKEIIRIKKESVKEDYQKRMAEIREKHQDTRNAFKRELAVRWEAGQIQRVTLAGLRGGATGAIGGAIGFELAGVAWGDAPVIGSLLAKAREITSPLILPAGELTWDSEGNLIQPDASTPSVSQVPEAPSVASPAPLTTPNIPPAMYNEGNWNLGHIGTDQAIPEQPPVPQTAPASLDNSGTGVGPREEDYIQPAVPDATQPGEAPGLVKPSGSPVAPAPAPPVSPTESAVAAGIIPKDGIIPLPEGSNPWNMAKDIGDKVLDRPLNDSEVLKLTKALSMDSKISVDDWKISGEGFTHHRFLPPGFKLNFGGANVIQALNELGSPALKLAA